MAALTRARTPWPQRLAAARGFTLVETLVAAAILTVGVLGTVAMIDGANAETSGAKGREGATGLARELIEMARSLPYESLETAKMPAALQSRPALADSSPAAGYTIVRRGIAYTVTTSACSIDDAKDGLGNHDSDVVFCSDSPGPGNPAKDRNPDDYKRIVITLAWTTDHRGHTQRQTTIVANPAGGRGPSVTGLQLTTPSASPITTNASTARFQVTTSATPSTLTWAVNGDIQGNATGSGNGWSFDWPLLRDDGSPTFLDGTYLVTAQAFDGQGRSGASKTVTVVLNRFAPYAPAGFAGGRNGSGTDVDLEWHASQEGDIVGYRVYRTDASGAPVARACPPASSNDQYLAGTSCVDRAAPASGPLHYVVVALDTAPAGGLREGPASPVLDTVESNAAPSAPTGLVACAGGDSGCTNPDGTAAAPGTTVLTWNPASDPDSGDSIQFYRIYRDGSDYGARYDRLYPGGALSWVDRNAGTGSHTYTVTAVDSHFAESAKSQAVAR